MLFRSSSFVAAGSPAPLATLSASRLVADRWVDDAPVPYQLAVGRLSLGGLVRRGAISASVAAVGRVEAEDLADPSLLAGPAAALTLASATTTVRFAGEADFGAYTWVGLTLDARAHTPIGHGELAGRVLATGVPTPDVPFHRLPTAGGAELLRGLPAGRFRAPTLYALQIEGRYPIVGPLHAAAFVDAARVEGDHFTAGGGLRLVLPPGRDNVTRVDVGFGPEGWGVVVAWGEAL